MNHHILLVEDDQNDADFFRRAVRKLDAPPSVVWCRNGQDALSQLRACTGREELPRVAILDIKMPGMNGLELLTELRKDEDTKNIPVIMMSSSDEPRDIRRAYREGANSYVVKPNRFQDLSQLVRSIDTFWVHANRLRPN